ncbi:MAG: L-seryl-tRNA(Sec) selenium transferase [Actinomycetota bacterium]
MDPSGELRKLPSVEQILRRLDAPHELAVSAARRAIDEGRARVRNGEPAPSEDEVARMAESVITEARRTQLSPVINATGVLVHTNLGRVPLGRRQLEAVARVAGGYSNLEYDVANGKRGSRYSHAERLINSAIGSDAALVVNNNAAAVLLVLAALCREREVIISRGELIEIGGEFRIPDVMAASGVTLVEVGTTNRTHIADYEKAIGPDTAAILKVHPSNYKMVGFTRSVPSRDLARLARGRGVCFIHDLGSGLVHEAGPVFSSEPMARAALEEGSDLVTFSGDKLLGGPQAGIIAGRSDLIAVISTHPLLRALRVDKMTLAALEATLAAYLEDRVEELPLWEMALAPLEGLQRRAEELARGIAAGVPAVKVEAVAVGAVAGGGSLPGEELDSWGLSVTHPERTPDEIERRLRAHEPPVIARIEQDRVLLDLRTVKPADDKVLLTSLTAALG